MSNGFLDFRYTIFGKLISGDNVRADMASTPVEDNSSGEDSEPLTPPLIESMSIVQETTGGGVFMLKAATGATGPYTVTVSDGTNTQTFTINIGTNAYDPPNPWVTPVNGTDKLPVAAGTPTQYTPQGVSADGQPVQVSVQTMLSIPSVSGAYVNNSFLATSTAQPDPAGPEYRPHRYAKRIELHGDARSGLLWQAGAGGHGLHAGHDHKSCNVRPRHVPIAGGSDNDGGDQFRQHQSDRHSRQHAKPLRASGFSGATVSVATSRQRRPVSTSMLRLPPVSKQ